MSERAVNRFSEVFGERRRVRRIPMRGFGVSKSYVHDIENLGMLPTFERLPGFIDTFRRVAEEQDADPESDTRELWRAWDQAQLERLGISSEAASLIAELMYVERTAPGLLAKPLQELLAELNPETGQG